MLHERLCMGSPELALRLLGDEHADVSHRALTLVNLVRRPEIACERLLERLRGQPAEDGLQVVEGLRQARINGRRSRRVGLSYLLGHEELAELVATHRQRVIRLLKHFLGERGWSAVRRALREPAPAQNSFLKTAVLRYTRQTDVALEALRFLAETRSPPPALPPRKPWLNVPWLTRAKAETGAGVEFLPRHPLLRKSLAARLDLEQGAGLPFQTLAGLRGVYHPQASLAQVRELSAIAARVERAGGAVTAAYKKLLSNGQSRRCGAMVRAAEAADRLPKLNLRLAVVLDASASMASSGERLHHPAALGQALAALVRAAAEETVVYQVGGSEANGVAHPQGPTDLAAAILAAARERPQAILVITDGYENVRQGDAAAVVAGLAQLGCEAKVIQVSPLFARSEDLSARRLGERVPVVAVEHEQGVGEVLARAWLAVLPETVPDEELPRLAALFLGGKA